MPGALLIAAIAGAAALCATSLSVALVGLGLPFFGAALLTAIGAGAAVYLLAPRAAPASLPAPPPVPAPVPEVRPDPAAGQVRQLLDMGSALRHDLRGVLSPALMMTDRLLKSDDPKIRRAGEAVVKSIERATALLAENKTAELAAAAEPPP